MGSLSQRHWVLVGLTQVLPEQIKGRISPLQWGSAQALPGLKVIEELYGKHLAEFRKNPGVNHFCASASSQRSCWMRIGKTQKHPQGFSGVNKISSRSMFSQARTPETELRARIVPASVLVLFWFCSGSIPGSVLVLFLALFLVLFWFSFGSVLILFWFYFSSIPGSIPGSVPGSVLFLFWLCSGSIPDSVPGSVLVLF